MASSDYFVSVVAPLDNDADIIAAFLGELSEVLTRNYTHYEIVLVDDGSTDDTAARVSDILGRFDCIRMIQLSRRFGTEVAILAGLESVIGDFVIVMLPDMDPPELVPSIVEQSRKGAGIVCGVRRSREGESRLMRLGVSMFYWYCNYVLKMKIPRNSTYFRVVSRQVVNAIIRIKDRLRYLRLYSAYVGFRSETFVYDPISRSGDVKRRSLWQSARLAIGVVIANSTHPLRAVSILGILISGVNALYAGYVLVTRLFVEDVPPGWAGQSLQSAIMFFFLFLTLTVLCEYVGRILGESRDRPLYYVLEERKSSVILDEEARKNIVSQSVEEEEGSHEREAVEVRPGQGSGSQGGRGGGTRQ